MSDTTPVPSQVDGPQAQESTQENWEQRYVGLQKVLAKRDTDLTDRQAALDALRAEKEAADLELAEYRQARVDASEKEAARTQYEQLRERFAAEERPPAPISNAAPRPNDWFERDKPGRWSPAYDAEGNPEPNHSWVPNA